MRAVASKPDRYARRHEDHFVVRRGVSWPEFQRALEERGERSNRRMAYLEGILEIMSPGSNHEGLKGVIGRLVEVWCLEHDIDFTTLGSWALQDESVARAVEPDECYVFGPTFGEASRPDLAIEVIWTSGSINKLEIYRKLAVREVWIWRRGRLTAHALRGELYEPMSESLVLPGIDLSQLAALLDQPTTSAAIRAYRNLLRKP
ncbi:MAG TPA: Uma2 family endonuclease [Thermoanaerobaculia bacterium]|nr:Uma2 family endonuclease [Thermoanaerobaculia bacterium]